MTARPCCAHPRREPIWSSSAGTRVSAEGQKVARGWLREGVATSAGCRGTHLHFSPGGDCVGAVGDHVSRQWTARLRCSADSQGAGFALRWPL